MVPEKHLMGCFIPRHFSGPVVELVHDGLYLYLSDRETLIYRVESIVISLRSLYEVQCSFSVN